MNEHHQPHRERYPRMPAPDHAEEQSLAALDELDPHQLADALAKLRAFQEAAGGYGEAFLAYLDLELAEPVKGSEVEDFLSRYLGHYADRHTFIHSRLDEIGLSQALAEFAEGQGMWPNDVTWDEAVVWDHMSERYALSERFGGVHAFRR